MTVKRDPDAILAAWLEEGPTALPEPTRRAIAVTTRTTTQRRHPIWVPRGRPLMSTNLRWAVAAIAVILAIGGAAYFLAPAGGQVGGPPTLAPSPSASNSAIASPTPAGTSVATPFQLAKEGFVYPGTWVPAFDPPLTFTVDREVEHNCAPGFACRGSIDANLPGWMDLEFGIPRIEISVVRVDKVDDSVQPSQVSAPPGDLAAWLASRPGLTVTSQKKTTVGGLAATRLDLRIGTGNVEIGPIPGVNDPAVGFGPNSAWRVYVVGVRGKQILISLNAEDGSVDELQPLVDSIVWR